MPTPKFMLYNGKTWDEIADNMPCNMPEVHKELYLKNVCAVIERQTFGVNMHEIEAIKNYNWYLISPYVYSALN